MTVSTEIQCEIPALHGAGYRIGLGTYRLGEATQGICLKALELGYRHIDTASLYGNEEAVSRAIHESGVDRNEVFVTSKIHPRDIGAGRITEAVDESLSRLQRIDLLLLHAPAGDYITGWNRLQEAFRHGDIRQIGVSNFDIFHLERLEGTLPVWNQIEVSPFLKRQRLVEWCRSYEVGIIAHSSLTKGRRLGHPVVKAIARSNGMTPAQVMICWAVTTGFAVLPRTANHNHLQENLDAGKQRLTDQDMAKLNNMEDGFATHPQHLVQGGIRFGTNSQLDR